MNPGTNNKERLLFEDTNLSTQQFSKRDVFHNRPANHFLTEELEKTCRAGMLYEPLPEQPCPGYKMTIWNIRIADHFHLPGQDNSALLIENENSVDTQLFFLAINLN